MVPLQPDTPRWLLLAINAQFLGANICFVHIYTWICINFHANRLEHVCVCVCVFVCVCAVRGSCEPISLFLEPTSWNSCGLLSVSPCVTAEPWEERAGQAMGFVRMLTECVCALCGVWGSRKPQRLAYIQQSTNKNNSSFLTVPWRCSAHMHNS